MRVLAAPGNAMLIVALTFGIMISSTYALGRIHQWHRHGEMRDEAYRCGYDKAAHALLTMVQNADRGRPAQGLIPQSRADLQGHDGLPARNGARTVLPAVAEVGTGRRRLPLQLSDASR